MVVFVRTVRWIRSDQPVLFTIGALGLCCAALPSPELQAASSDSPSLTGSRSPELSESRFELWQGGEGWPQGPVTAVIQSHDGYIWLGTYTGLMRFDGVRFTVFDSSNARGLKNSRVTSLYEDDQQVLWIGHETGELTRFANGTFEPMALGPAWPGGAIEGISTDDQGDLWLLNGTGFLFRVRDGQSAEAPGASATRKAIFTRARNGKLWIVCSGSVALLEQGKTVPVQFPDSTSNDFFEQACPAHEGGLWVLGNQRVRRFRDGHWLSQEAEGPPGGAAVTVMIETRSGALLAGTLREGLYVLTPGARPLHFNRANGLTHDWIRTLCEDREGNIWIGTGGGFQGLRPRKVQMLDAPDHWQGCVVLSFCVRADGSAWIGTEGAGLYHYDHGNWANFTETNGVANAFVWSVLETKGGQLLVGTWGGGLLVKEGDRFGCPSELSRLTTPVVSMYEGAKGEVWIGTISGLHRYEGGKLTWSAGKDKLLLPDVRTIAEGADGTLWFGMSGGGLGALKDGTLRQFTKADGLPGDFVMCLTPEPDGTLWFGTSDNGLGRWKAGKFAGISTEQGLPNNVISHIVDDGAGNFWIGTHAGILRVSKADLERCADGLTNSVYSLSYGRAEGLASPICSGGFQPGACRTPDGQLWFPTAKGLAIIDPANVTANAVPPPVVIEELRVDGQLQNLAPSGSKSGRVAPVALGPKGAALQIAPGRQRFEFHYTGLSFTAPDKVRFKYKLEGLQQDWTDAGAERVANFSYLRPGPYTFHVTACNNDNVWNDEGAALAFTVLPQFWQTWWFNLVSLASGAGGVGAGVFWLSRRRVRRRLEQSERQRALERERTRIARDIHDDLGASLTRITLLSQTARSELDANHQAAADVDRIYTTARELTRAMDEVVWAVNPQHDSLDSLVTYLGRFAQNFLSAAQIRCRLEVPVSLPAWPLTAETRHNVFLAFKEALHNVVKHAGASEVRICLELLPDGFVLLIVDNGHGFDWNQIKPRATPDGVRMASGNGVPNMQKRLEEVGGRCEWITAPQEGTRVKFWISVERARE
ncbi:Histidine kinase [Verrucomicrobia bacterium]|nr:Histidine kinase [Verrucomicrobiota bacterium]